MALEASGGLELEAAQTLQEQGFAVSIINPRQGRDFAKASGKLAKTDRIDAAVLAHFGQAMQPPLTVLSLFCHSGGTKFGVAISRLHFAMYASYSTTKNRCFQYSLAEVTKEG